MHVGKRVRARRALLGLSQERLGKMLGLTFQQIQKYERGTNRISAGRLFEMARLLGVSVPYFYEGVSEDAPRRYYGFAEEGAPAPSPKESGTRADGMQLMRAYAQISDPKVRRQVVELVKSLSAEQKRKRR